MKNKNLIAVLLAIFVAAASVFAGGGQEPGAPRTVNLEWAAGGSGGMWYVLSAGLAQLISEQAPHIRIRVIPGAGVQNSITVGENRTELGFGMPNLVMDAYRGRGSYDRRFQEIRGIANGFSFNYYHLVAAEDTGIRTFEEFWNARNNWRFDANIRGGSGEEIWSKIMGFYNTSYAELQARGARFFYNAHETISLNMRDRHIDFAGMNIIPPSAVIHEISAARRIRFLALPEPLRQYLNREHGFGLGVIRRDSYPTLLTEDIPTVTTGTMLMAHSSLDEEIVYTIARIINENPQRLVNIDRGLADFSAAEAWKDMPVPLHPGAERYYRSRGHMR